MLFASDIPCHLEMGLGLFCGLGLGLGFFVSLLKQETIVIHLVDRTNITVINKELYFNLNTNCVFVSQAAA